MPRLTAVLPKYRRFSARNLGFVEVGGKRTYFPGKYNSAESKQAYRRFLVEWEAAGRPITPPPPANQLTVVELIAAFLRHAKAFYLKDGQPTGTAENFKPALSLLKEFYGKTTAAEFGPLALKALRQRMVDSGASRRYINDNVARIRQVFKWAASEEMIPVVVVQSLATVTGLQKHRTTARENSPIEPADDADVEKTLPHLSAVVADMVRFQRLTGARPGEVCVLRPCDVERTSEVWVYRPASHKTQHHGRDRVILIGPQGQDVLRKYLLRDAAAFCFQPAEAVRERFERQAENRKTPLTCGNRPGTNRKAKPRRVPSDRYTNDSYRRAVARACDLAGVKQWAPNQLRHAAATEVRRQFGLEAAQAVLGHSKADVTQIYAERDLRKAAEVMAKIG